MEARCRWRCLRRSKAWYREWVKCYRALNCALERGDDLDLFDRIRMEEMRRTILGWAWNSGYVRYDRDRGVWQQLST